MSQDTKPDAGELVKRIFDSLFAHDPSLPPIHRYHRDLREELRIQPLAEDAALAEGDVLIILDTSKQVWAHGFGDLTAREARDERGARLAMVESSTAKTVTVRLFPTYLNRRANLSDLASEFSTHTERFNKTGKYRRIGYVGTIEGLQAKINAHSDYVDWKAAHVVALAEYARQERELEAEKTRQAEEAKPFLAAAERLNTALGAKAVRVSMSSLGHRTSFTADWEWLAKGRQGVVYLHGLVALGELSSAALEQALADLQMLAAETGR